MRLAGRHGSLLVVTLWLVALLAVMAVAIARYLSLEIRVTKRHLARAQARALARGGVYLVMTELAKDLDDADEPYDWTGDTWALPKTLLVQDDVTLTLSVQDEERKINLNAGLTEAVMREQLTSLLHAADLAQAVIDYVDPADPAEPTQAQPPYAPKNGPVSALEELGDLPGMTEEVFGSLRQFTTAAEPGATHTININTAGRDVLVALGGDPATVDSLIASRPGPDGQLGTDDDCKAADTERSAWAAELAACAQLGDPAPMISLLSLPTVTFTNTSSTFLVSADVAMPSVKGRAHVQAMLRRKAEEPTRIIAWSEW